MAASPGSTQWNERIECTLSSCPRLNRRARLGEGEGLRWLHSSSRASPSQWVAYRAVVGRCGGASGHRSSHRCDSSRRLSLAAFRLGAFARSSEGRRLPAPASIMTWAMPRRITPADARSAVLTHAISSDRLQASLPGALDAVEREDRVYPLVLPEARSLRRTRGWCFSCFADVAPPRGRSRPSSTFGRGGRAFAGSTPRVAPPSGWH